MRVKIKKIVSFLIKPQIFFLLIAFVLVNLWFSKNLLFGGTEVGVPTYAPEKILKQISWTWWEALGPGVSIPTVSAAIPFYIFMSILERIGLGEIAIQKIFFFLIIYLQGLGLSLVFKIILPNKEKLSILAGLFYIFNPFMMTFIWHRFIFANFFLSASLPFFLYFYLQLLEKGQFKYIFLFLLTAFLSSYMSASIAPVMALWISILVFYMVALAINRRNIKKILKITYSTGALFGLWILTNLWWIYPLLNIKTIFNAFTTHGGVETLIALSDKSTINYVIRGINPYFLFITEDWGSIYSSLFFQSISWIPVLFVLVALISKRPNIKIWYLIILFLVGILISKGAAEPFGDFTAWVYAHFFILSAVRNPFEKLGLLVVLPASILITIGISNIWVFYKNIFSKIIIIILILGSGVYLWPMWSDRLFGSEKYPLLFTPPKDYQEVSEFLYKQLESDSGRVLHLPIMEEDSATYNWSYPYNGVELSFQLFPGSSVSRFLYISFIDKLLQNTARIFHSKQYDTQKNLLSNLGIKYIILNKNLDWSIRSTDNPFFVKEILDTSPDLEIIKETENLKVYKFISKTLPKVFSANNLTVIPGSIEYGSEFDFVLNNTRSEGGVFLQPRRNQQINKEVLKREVIYPYRVFNSLTDLGRKLDIIVPRPYVKHLPGSFLDPLIRLKERIEFLFSPDYQKPMQLVSLTQKRLIEAKLLNEDHREKEFIQSIKLYLEYLNSALTYLRKVSNQVSDSYTKTILMIIYKEEKELLDSMDTYDSKEARALIEQAVKKIIDFRKEAGFDTYYVYSSDTILSRNTNIYQFLVSEKINPELLLVMPPSKFFDQYANQKIKVFIDGEQKEVVLVPKNDKGLFSLGNITMDPGVHEVAVLLHENNELLKITNFYKKSGLIDIDNQDNKIITMTTKEDGSESWLEYKLEGYDPNKTYIIEFDYKAIKGEVPQIQFWQESDKLTENDKPKIIRPLEDDYYDFGWKHIKLSISSNNSASIHLGRSTINPTIRIIIPFWNNCEAKNSRNVKLCKDLKFKKKYNRSSIVQIRDLKIVETFTGQMFLFNLINNSTSSNPLNYQKISPVEYRVEIDNNSKYSYVVLNEGFHSDWKVIFDSEKGEIIDENSHYLTNGYANGWLVDKSGKLSFKIKFIPQDYLYKGIAISLTTVILLGIFLVVKKIRLNRGKNE